MMFPKLYQFIWKQPRLMWKQPPRPSRPSGAGRPSAQAFLAVLVLILRFASLPASAASWTVHAQPTRLVNGAPVLFQVKAPAKLDSLTGTWLAHELTFSYDSSTKTWFALAGVTFETAPGKYALTLTGTRTATNTPLVFTRPFMVARAQYPKIKVELSVEKKFTEPSPEQQAQIAEGVKIKQDYLSRVTTGTAASLPLSTRLPPTSTVLNASSTALRSVRTGDSITAFTQAPLLPP
jgi:hypothetical protein